MFLNCIDKTILPHKINAAARLI